MAGDEVTEISRERERSRLTNFPIPAGSAKGGGKLPIATHADLVLDPTRAVRIATLITIVLPLIGLIAGMILLWPIGFGWTALGLLLAFYVFTGLGITVGFHRYFTHKSFETSRVMKWILGIAGSMACEGSILYWVATHRCHHQHSDSEHDPHSPHHHGKGVWAMIKGAWHAHVGWMLPGEQPNVHRYAPDLARDRNVLWMSRLFPLWVLLGLAIPTVLGGVITLSWSGALLGLIWGGLVRVLLVHHITWSINSVCHIWGSRPFASHDHSRNNLIFGIFAFGEGWHNNHHAFPTSARHGLRWWELDTSYIVIKGLSWIGVTRDVKVPSRERIEAKKKAA
ncbi:MAG: acyl-CoA desaturase [Planctomycetota bacterium]|nr:MAG: acyl-CoA desaturase [Planctomycetota bacterium]